MRDYQEILEPSNYSLYLLQGNLSEELLSRVHQKLVGTDNIVSFERLLKNNRLAITVYCNKEVIGELQSLNPIEIEDYTNQLGADITSWEQEIGKGLKGFQPDIFSGLNLGEEQIFLQLVLQAKKIEFGVTMRLAVVGDQSIKRTDLAKVISHNLSQLGLKRKQKLNSATVFDFYKKRSTYPKQINKQTLNSQQIVWMLH